MHDKHLERDLNHICLHLRSELNQNTCIFDVNCPDIILMQMVLFSVEPERSVHLESVAECFDVLSKQIIVHSTLLSAANSS